MECGIQCTRKVLSHFIICKAVKLFLKCKSYRLYSSTLKRSFIVRFVMESFKDYLGMLNTDLILAYCKLDFWRIIPTLENTRVFFFLILPSLDYIESKSNLPAKSLDLICLSPHSGIVNLELCLKNVRDFKNYFVF